MTGIGYFVFYITGSDFKTFPEVFFYFIHHRKWLFVYLYIYFPKWFLLWQEVVILFFTWPEASDYLFPKVIFLYTSESDFFRDRKWLFCFLHYGKWFKNFFRKFFFLLFMTGSDCLFIYSPEWFSLYFQKWFFSWQEVVIFFFT